MTTTLLALGSNLGDRHAHLHDAVTRLGQLPATRVIALSSFRETQPVDCPPETPPFINAAAKVETRLPVADFLGHLLAIEQVMGRKREPSAQPTARPIDLDLLIFENAIIQQPQLTVPHPRMHRRLFVLEPAAEIAPDLRHPLLHKTMLELLREAQQNARPERKGT